MTLSTDPIDLALDASGTDLVMPPRFARGIEAVVQEIKIRLRRVRGEWFLDRDAGVPYLPTDIVPEGEALLGQKFNAVKARTAIRDELVKSPGVVELLALAVSFEGATRTLRVEFRVRTAFGDSDLEKVEV
jgi:hypothetical protein